MSYEPNNEERYITVDSCRWEELQRCFMALGDLRDNIKPVDRHRDDGIEPYDLIWVISTKIDSLRDEIDELNRPPKKEEPENKPKAKKKGGASK